MKDKDIQNLLNDLQARLHQTDMVAKKQKFEIDLLKNSLNAGLKNIISLALAAKKSLNVEDLSKYSGISGEQIGPFLKQLKEEGKIKEEDGMYSLNHEE